MAIETEGVSAFPVLGRMFAVTGRSRLKDFSRMASGKPGPSKDGRHASFNMKSITLTDGCLPIACYQEHSHRPSRTAQVLRPTYSNASPFRFNCPRKNEGASHGIRRRTAHVPWAWTSLGWRCGPCSPPISRRRSAHCNVLRGFSKLIVTVELAGQSAAAGSSKAMRPALLC
jgi:hypothetical protein